MDDDTLTAMETYGGSFIRTLAALYRRADDTNRRTLLSAFGHYFTEYAELAVLRKGRTDG